MVDIIICSSSDIEFKEAMELNVMYAPLQVNINGKWYKDGVDLSNQEFNDRLETLETIPTTSQVTPLVFEELYKQVKEEAVVITPSLELSGTYQSAIFAKEGFNNIYVVDSTSGSIGEKILVKRAIELRDQGLSAMDIYKILEEEKKDIRFIGVLDTLKYLSKGGRLSKTQAAIGGLIKIKPVLALESGKIQVLGKARGPKKAGNFLFEYVENSGGIDFDRPIAIGYSGKDKSVVKTYIEGSHILYEGKIETLPIGLTGSVIGTHAGPNAALFAYFVKK